jgi:HEAT repeat protein
MGLKKNTEPGGEFAQLQQLEPRVSARGCDGCLTQLADADPVVRRWGARDLAGCPDAAAALCRHLPGEADLRVREAVFTSLACIGGAEVAQGLLPLLRSEDAGLRNGAIEVLGGLGEAAAPHVEALLADADADVRIFAVNLLAQLKHPRVPQWLCEVLQRDAAVNVVAAALEAAAEACGPEAAAAVRSAAQRFEAEHPFMHFASRLVLQRIGAEG